MQFPADVDDLPVRLPHEKWLRATEECQVRKQIEKERRDREEDKGILCGEAKSFEQHLLGSFELWASSHTYGSISIAESRLSIECETQSQWHTLWQ